jgi:hypothetical protein
MGLIEMSGKRISAGCEFEAASAADILDGLGTLSGRAGQGVMIPAPGDGPDKPLSWSIQEVTNAFQIQAGPDRDRLCTNAVLNSRRALACLVEWYVERDLGKFCRNPPSTAKEQAEFLMRRGVIDELTSHVLERAIDKRNRVEHDFIAPELETAEDVVELLRRTIAAIRNQSDPSCAPWVFGIMLFACGSGEHGLFAEFHGWSEPLAVFSRFPPRPWIGLVLPDGQATALVRRAFLSDIATDELTQVLSLAEQRYGRPSSFSGVHTCRLLSHEMGLLIDT